MELRVLRYFLTVAKRTEFLRKRQNSCILHSRHFQGSLLRLKELGNYYTYSILCGMAKGWAVFRLAKEVWEPNEGDLPYEDESMRIHAKSMLFPIGEANDGFAQYFTGKVILRLFQRSR